MEPAEFLRRFSIIMLEDSLLAPSLPLLVWLMMAQAKGFQLGRLQASACLNLVHQVAQCPVRDHVSAEGLPFLDGVKFLAAPSHPHMVSRQPPALPNMGARACVRTRVYVRVSMCAWGMGNGMALGVRCTGG